jgi:hypothetical protein
MKKWILFSVMFMAATLTKAQIPTEALTVAKFIPTLQFGLKGGVNLTGISTSTSATLSTGNQAGYLFGAYAKVGKIIQFEPEIYITGKNVTLTDNNGVTNTVKFTSIDVPLLLVKNWGLLGFGFHIDAGPVISFVVDQNQSLAGAYDKITKFEYNNQAVALQLGTGVTIQGLTVDLRYEHGLNSLSKDGYPDTKISMFNLSVGIKIY